MNSAKNVCVWERSYEDIDTCYIPMALIGSSVLKKMLKIKPMFASKLLFLVANLPFRLPLFSVKKYFGSFKH